MVLSMKHSKSSTEIRKITALGIFAAFAYLSLYAFRIAGIGGFLTFDIKDTIVCLSAMIFGPLSGVSIALLVALIEMVTVSGTGIWGFIMNFASTAVFSAVASCVYMYIPKLKKTMKGAIIGLLLAVLTSTITMLLLNIFVTPIYLGVEREAVFNMLVPVLLPFNFSKSLLNAACVMLLYKPIKEILKKTGFVRSTSENYKFDKRSVILTAVGIVIIILCLVFFVFAMDGQFKFFDK